MTLQALPTLLTSLLVSLLVFCINSTLALESDQHQMIKIQADSAYHNEKKGLTIYKGKVELQQGSLKIQADKITINTDNNGDVSSLTALGTPAKLEQKPALDQDKVYGRANLIRYDIHKSKMTLKGNAHIKQGQAELNSDNIVYLANQQIFKAERDKNSKNQKTKRVQMIIPPKKRSTEEK
ncbi:MAG: lipopolysaccharide transport periplasmic protein LptA [Pseudomonadales bacterium]|nr:lipopolysaccharide transport periplasmic protein LptA [Pseudomonadales bacterium]